MPFATKKISFGLVVALLLGWGAMSLLTIEASKQLLLADTLDGQRPVQLPKGVQLRVEVDKNVYSETDIILISIRNDSRQPVWLAERADGCHPGWWKIEQLFDADQWRTVELRRSDCVQSDYGWSEFVRHTLHTDTWDGSVQTADIGEIFRRVATGTYRVSVPFLHGQQTADDWGQAKTAVSTSFTIQGSNQSI